MFLEMILTRFRQVDTNGNPECDGRKISLRMYVVSHENLIAMSIHFQCFHLVLWSMKEDRLLILTRSGWVWSWPCHPHRCNNNTSFPMLEHHQLRRSVGDPMGSPVVTICFAASYALMTTTCYHYDFGKLPCVLFFPGFIANRETMVNSIPNRPGLSTLVGLIVW